MTSINTEGVAGYGNCEIEYLKAIQFVAITEDGKNISFPTDEEGNNEIILTPKATKWLIEELKLALKQINQ